MFDSLPEGVYYCQIMTICWYPWQMVPWTRHPTTGRGLAAPTQRWTLHGTREYQLPRRLHTLCRLWWKGGTLSYHVQRQKTYNRWRGTIWESQSVDWGREFYWSHLLPRVIVDILLLALMKSTSGIDTLIHCSLKVIQFLSNCSSALIELLY